MAEPADFVELRKVVRPSMVYDQTMRAEPIRALLAAYDAAQAARLEAERERDELRADIQRLHDLPTESVISTETALFLLSKSKAELLAHQSVTKKAEAEAARLRDQRDRLVAALRPYARESMDWDGNVSVDSPGGAALLAEIEKEKA